MDVQTPPGPRFEPMQSQSPSRTNPIGMYSVIGVVLLVAAMGLFLVVFYKPFPTITVLNAADEPIEDVELHTVSSETQWQTHELGTLQPGESLDVIVRGYEVTVRSLHFKLGEAAVEYEADPLPLTQGQAWRLTIEPDGEVTSYYDY